MLKLTMIIINILAFAITFTACNSSSSDSYPAAPLNDEQALKNLAAAYETVAETIPSNPAQLRPSARKKFVTQVFTKAGYSYFETLNDLAKIPAGSPTQYHEDMKQLLFLPHYRVNFDDIKEIYSDQEIQAILAIESNFNSH